MINASNSGISTVAIWSSDKVVSQAPSLRRDRCD